MEIVKEILKKRGIMEEKEIEKFLNPSPPSNFIQENPVFAECLLDEIGERVKKAIKNKEAIFIHGDYDVDGLCATAILWETIYYNLSYQNVHPFIPHRITHGYGLTKESVNDIAQKKKAGEKALLFTLDCGITAPNEVEYAKSLGFDVIILDHHTKQEKVPQALVALHAESICATSISWILAQKFLSPNFPKTSFLDLVAIATISDLEPLTGLNRSLVKYGLRELNQTIRPGLQELLKAAGIKDRVLGPYEVGWIIGPRLNAMGRLEHALDSLRLLCTKSQTKALELADKLEQTNRERQQMTEKALLQAKEIISNLTPHSDGTISNPSILLLSHPQWHEGIIGLIAGKITEEFGKPTIAIAQGEKISKGSGRSINGLDLFTTINQHKDLLVNFGGHPQACGFTIETEKIEEFKRRFLVQSPALEIGSPALATKPAFDLKLDLSDLEISLVESLGILEPFGLGNREPRFLTTNLKIDDLRFVGKNNQHLKLKVSQKDQTFNAIGFNFSLKEPSLEAGDKIDLIYSLDINSFNKQRSLQLKIKKLEKIYP